MIIIVGAGDYGIKIKRKICNESNESDVLFYDNDRRKWGDCPKTRT